MDNSHKFFANRDCAYYPCHEGVAELNCLFCYCPLYHLENCPGKPSYKDKNGKWIKVCTCCSFPHHAENYDAVMRVLKKSI